MNTLIALVLGVVVAYLAYAVYAKNVDAKILKADAKKATPARMYMDGVDFTPASKNILYGYQFKSIAAAGPIVGTITAATLWGWLPALLWLFVGVSFIGWVQDYGAIMMSTRRDGDSISALAHRLISPRSRSLLLVFIFFYLLLIAGAFGNLLAANLVGQPSVPLGIIVLALAGLLGGQMLYRWKMPMVTTTIVVVGLTLLAILLGPWEPIKSAFASFNTWLNGLNGNVGVITFFDPTANAFKGADTPLKVSYVFWLLAVLVFSYFGSVLPIWRWAQPINYIGFWIMSITIVGAIIGAAIAAFANPWLSSFQLQSFIAWDPRAGKAGVDMQPLWPMLFVTIACGAVSGWHSLVSTVGSARQIEYETDALPVGAGSMVSEMILALVALMAIAVAGKGAGAPAFAAGIGNFLSVFGINPTFGQALGFATFIIIVITVTQLVIRFMRVALTEALGDRFPIARNMQVGTLVSLVLMFIVVLSGTFVYLWQLFGGANQLMASLALLLITLWLINEKKNAIWTAVPFVFMYVTTIVATLITARNLWVTVVSPNMNVAGRGMAVAGGFLMIAIAVLLVLAALFVGWEAYGAYMRLRAKGTPAKGEKVAPRGAR